ncbi:hypothetical protein L210DRAFT_3537907, partial [Boletus edulis BED1]
MGLSPNSPSLALTWMYLSWRVAQCTDKSFQYIQCQAVGGLIAAHAYGLVLPLLLVPLSPRWLIIRIIYGCFASPRTLMDSCEQLRSLKIG